MATRAIRNAPTGATRARAGDVQGHRPATATPRQQRNRRVLGRRARGTDASRSPTPLPDCDGGHEPPGGQSGSVRGREGESRPPSAVEQVAAQAATMTPARRGEVRPTAPRRPRHQPDVRARVHGRVGRRSDSRSQQPHSAKRRATSTVPRGRRADGAAATRPPRPSPQIPTGQRDGPGDRRAERGRHRNQRRGWPGPRLHTSAASAEGSRRQHGRSRGGSASGDAVHASPATRAPKRSQPDPRARARTWRGPRPENEENPRGSYALPVCRARLYRARTARPPRKYQVKPLISQRPPR